MSTFALLREVLAFRDFKDDSYNSWSFVTSVSFHALFTGRIELNQSMLSSNFSVNRMAVRTDFITRNLSHDFRFWAMRQSCSRNGHLAFYDKSWIIVWPLSDWSGDRSAVLSWREGCVQPFNQGVGKRSDRDPFALRSYWFTIVLNGDAEFRSGLYGKT